MKKIARAEKNKKNGLLPILASLSRQRLWAPCHDKEPRSRQSRVCSHACSHCEGVLAHATQPCALDQVALRVWLSVRVRPTKGFYRDSAEHMAGHVNAATAL